MPSTIRRHSPRPTLSTRSTSNSRSAWRTAPTAFFDLSRASRVVTNRAAAGTSCSHRPWSRWAFVRVKSLPSCHLLTKDDVKVVIPVYVDDKLLICNSRVFADKLIIEFKRRHKLRHLGPATSFLGMHLTRDRK